MTYQLIILAFLLASSSSSHPQTNGPLRKQATTSRSTTKSVLAPRTANSRHTPPAKGRPTSPWAVVVASPHPTKSQVQLIENLYLTRTFVVFGRPIASKALRTVLAGAPFVWTTEEARATLTAARLSYATVKLQQAIGQLRRAESLYLRYVPSAQARKGLHQTWALMVLAYHSLGMSKQARQAAENLALLEPSGKPVPPAIWKQYAPSRRGKMRRTLSVDGLAGATLLVDFKPVPPTTRSAGRDIWTIKVRRAGHHVMLDAPGHAKFYAWVPSGSKDTQLTAVMPARPADTFMDLRAFLATKSDKGPGLDPTDLKKVAQQAGAHLLLVAWFEAQNLRLRAFDASHKRYVGATITLHGSSGRMAQNPTWTKQVAQAFAPRKPRPPLPRKALSKSTKKAADQQAKRAADQRKLKAHHKGKPLWKRWYFWVAIGAVGILAGVFAYKNKDNSTSDVVQVRVHRP